MLWIKVCGRVSRLISEKFALNVINTKQALNVSNTKRDYPT